jgi:hypothetical protein
VNQGFKMDVSVTPSHTAVNFSGVLDGTSVYQELNLNLPIVMNFNGITRIDSTGVRNWCIWINRLKASPLIEFEECRAILVKNFALVKGSIPENVQVTSFYVPVYSPTTGERREVLLSRGREFDQNGVKVPDQLDSGGKVMDIDVAESYWSFLK